MAYYAKRGSHIVHRQAKSRTLTMRAACGIPMPSPIYVWVADDESGVDVRKYHICATCTRSTK